MDKRKKTADLLRVLGQRTPSVPASSLKQEPLARSPRPQSHRQGTPESSQSRAARSRPPARPPIRGKAIQFYLHEPDEKLIREFAVWLAPHRKRINDSLVVKTVLRAAKTGSELLAAYDAAVKVDGRTRRNRPESPKDAE